MEKFSEGSGKFCASFAFRYLPDFSLLPADDRTRESKLAIIPRLCIYLLDLDFKY